MGVGDAVGVAPEHEGRDGDTREGAKPLRSGEGGGVVLGELSDRPCRAAEQLWDVGGQPFCVAVGEQASASAFIPATFGGSPARIISAWSPSRLRARNVTGRPSTSDRTPATSP